MEVFLGLGNNYMILVIIEHVEFIISMYFVLSCKCSIAFLEGNLYWRNLKELRLLVLVCPSISKYNFLMIWYYMSFGKCLLFYIIYSFMNLMESNMTGMCLEYIQDKLSPCVGYSLPCSYYYKQIAFRLRHYYYSIIMKTYISILIYVVLIKNVV